MRKLILLLFGIIPFIYSNCSKEKEIVPIVEVLYPVTFDIGTFSKEILPNVVRKSQSITSQSSNLNHAIGYITYCIFDNKNSIAASGTVSASNSDKLSSIKIELPEGKYTINILGSEKGYSIYNFDNPDNVHIAFPTIDNIIRTEDIFFKKLEFSVAAEPFVEHIELERIVGKLEVKITDEIPDDIYAISVVIHNARPYKNLSYDNLDNFGITGDFEAKRDAVSGKFLWEHADFPLYFFMGEAVESRTTVEINAWRHSDGSLVARTFIEDVPIGVNQKTILTGKLFEKPIGNEPGLTGIIMQTGLTGKLFQSVSSNARALFSNKEWSYEMKTMD